jgi:gas vesicle protein
MKDSTTTLIIGLILGIIIGGFAGYQFAEKQNRNCIRINLDKKSDVQKLAR